MLDFGFGHGLGMNLKVLGLGLAVPGLNLAPGGLVITLPDNAFVGFCAWACVCVQNISKVINGC